MHVVVVVVDGVSCVYQQLIKTSLGVDPAADLSSALCDGVILCHLANHVRPGSVSKVHVPTPAMVKALLCKHCFPYWTVFGLLDWWLAAWRSG